MNQGNFATTVDEDLLNQLLLQVERCHHAEGWHDNPHMHLYIIYDNRDVVTRNDIEHVTRNTGATIRQDYYSARVMLPPRMFRNAAIMLGQEADETLIKWTHSVAYIDLEKLRAEDGEYADYLEAFRHLISMPGIIGFASIAEGYALRNNTIRANVDRAALSADVSDHPDSAEVRTLIMVDTLDRLYVARRYRGEEVELEDDNFVDQSHAAPMRLLVDLGMNRLPETQEEYNQRY